MCKQVLVTLPLGLLLIDYWPLQRPEFATADGEKMTIRRIVIGWYKLFAEKVPFLALSAVVCIVTLAAQQGAMRGAERGFPLSVRLGNILISYVHYLAAFVWPAKLAVFYPLFPDSARRA